MQMSKVPIISGYDVAHNLCCQIQADDNSSTCTFTTGKSVTCTGRLLTKRKKAVMLELKLDLRTYSFCFLPGRSHTSAKQKKT